ncbi:universal stress protein [Kitasatospora sp. NPDC085895]|uniref:universal stress protein n=1 Tax=Kitasatospora sp. NPDC085895 TaxID=3155057 RepID=UPI00344DD0CC
MASASIHRPLVLGVDARGPGRLSTARDSDGANRRELPVPVVSAFPEPGCDLHGFEKRYREELRTNGRQMSNTAAGFAGERHPDLEVEGTLMDGAPSSAAAVDVAFDLAARRGAALRAIWVWQSPLVARVDEHAAVQTLRRLPTETTAGDADGRPDVRLTHEVIRGHPVEEPAKASEHALAVVVGRRGHGGFTGMRFGSVSHGLLHHAHCPSVTVPRPACEPSA